MRHITTYEGLLTDRQEQQDLDERLIYEVRMGRNSFVVELLEKGADPDCLVDGDTPLSWAAQKSDWEVMKTLLDAGADPNRDVRRWGKNVSILAMAITLGDPFLKRDYLMMELLLDAGADPNGRDGNGRPGLAILSHANNGDWDKYDLLFKHGADPNLPDDDGKVALHWPFKFMVADDVPIARILMLNGADPFKAVDDAQMVLDLFDGDISWLPDGPIKRRLGRWVKSKRLFGI